MREPISTPRRRVKQMVKNYEENIILPPPEFRDEYKLVTAPRTKKQVLETPILLPRTKKNEFKLDNNILDSTSNDQPVFKITEIGNTVNKKFGAHTNEFKINVRKNIISDKNDVFYVF